MYVCLSMFNSLKYQSFTRYGQKLQRRKHHLKQKLSIELFRLFVFTVVPRSQKLVDISKFQVWDPAVALALSIGLTMIFAMPFYMPMAIQIKVGREE